MKFLLPFLFLGCASPYANITSASDKSLSSVSSQHTIALGKLSQVEAKTTVVLDWLRQHRQ